MLYKSTDLPELVLLISWEFWSQTRPSHWRDCHCGELHIHTNIKVSLYIGNTTSLTIQNRCNITVWTLYKFSLKQNLVKLIEYPDTYNIFIITIEPIVCWSAKRLIHDLKRNQQTIDGSKITATTTNQSLQLSRFDDQSHNNKTHLSEPRPET